jgi:hypothetical protein
MGDFQLAIINEQLSVETFIVMTATEEMKEEALIVFRASSFILQAISLRNKSKSIEIK